MIGNASEAALILAVVHDKHMIWEERMMRAGGNFIGPVRRDPKLTEGWKRIGAGAYRSAWLSPSGVIYKVEHYYGEEYGQSNYGEYENILRILRSGRSIPGVRLPKATLYNLDGRSVMAMEYIDGKPLYCDCYYSGHHTQEVSGQCSNQVMAEIENVFGLNDMHSANLAYLPKQKEVVVLDIGA